MEAIVALTGTDWMGVTEYMNERGWTARRKALEKMLPQDYATSEEFITVNLNTTSGQRTSGRGLYFAIVAAIVNRGLLEARVFVEVED